MQSSSPRHDNNSARTDVESRGSGTTTITQVNQPEDNTDCESDHCRGHKGKAQKPEGGGGGDDHDGGPTVQT
uniref:Uncharacterized protein n=1 Tax=Meloidogyne javanica TaxID=6303 RepID=A0A915LID4_MELJA